MLRATPRVLTREQCRAVDRYAIEVLGIPGIVLMENAGRNAADFIHDTFAKALSRKATVVCGKGNNGGDGFVIARHLLRLGWDVSVCLASEPASFTGDAATSFAPLEKMHDRALQIIRISDPAACVKEWSSCLIVDALLGTGFQGEVREPLASVIAAINSSRGPGHNSAVVAVDVPSGLDADTGQPGGMVVEADSTVTFLAPKPGFAAQGVDRYTGKVHVADIGIPLLYVLEQLGIA